MTTKKNITPRRGSAKRAAAKKGTPRVKPDVDMVIDLVAEQEKQERRAALVLDFLNSDVNDYLTDAVMATLAAAAERIGFTLPEFVEPRAEQIKRLASPLTLTGFRFSLNTAPTTDSRNELEQFTHHLAEALRITRFNPLIPASLYNGLADALLDFENDLPSLSLVGESEPHILLIIEHYISQTREQAAKGGA
jgi:hypothetical protein